VLRKRARKGVEALERAFPRLALHLRRRLKGQFQGYNYTQPDRYPWLFEFVRAQLEQRQELRLLSFGCSQGDEVFALRRYFPSADIKGIDIDPRNITICRERAAAAQSAGLSFETADSTCGEPPGTHDAIFCLSVLCLSDLTRLGATRCDPFLKFDDFERLVTDFARCLKPGGLLLLHTTNFRFCDAAVSAHFDVVLEAEPGQLAPAVKFDRQNRLMRGERYRPVAFRKRDEFSR
jgi:SAM-dependent methyltransferase